MIADALFLFVFKHADIMIRVSLKPVLTNNKRQRAGTLHETSHQPMDNECIYYMTLVVPFN